MGKNNKRKRYSGDSGSSGGGRSTKNKHGGGSKSDEGGVSVSETIHGANYVLYEDIISTPNDSVFEHPNTPAAATNATSSADSDETMVKQVHVNPTSMPAPSNTDILNFLKIMDSKIATMGNKLKTLETLEKKILEIETDMKKMWVHVHDNVKTTNEQISNMSDRIEALEFSLGTAHDQITQLNKEKVEIKDNLLYVQSQSMRNNLIFANIKESEHETPKDCEQLVRDFLVQKLQLAQSVVDDIGFERVHRTGERSPQNKPRHLVAKFSAFKDRELVRRSKRQLHGSEFYIYEQFPKAIADRRRALRPRLRKAISEGKRAWISYDTLYIDGRQVRDNNV